MYCKWRGKLVTDAQKQSIHACRRDKTKNSAAAQSIVRSICPKSMPWNSPGMPESGRMKKTKNRQMCIRDRLYTAWADFAYANEPALLGENYSMHVRGGRRAQMCIRDRLQSLKKNMAREQ